MQHTRRAFLQDSIAMAGLAATGSFAFAQTPGSSTQDTTPLPTPSSTRKGDMLYRTLGRTGEEVSLIGVGGSHIGKQKDEQESIRIIRSAIDRGITFMDNAWDYNDGKSEIRMGKALRDGYRGKVFLMTKIDGRTREAAAQQIDESLRRLQTDHLDLLQLHEVIGWKTRIASLVKMVRLRRLSQRKRRGRYATSDLPDTKTRLCI